MDSSHIEETVKRIAAEAHSGCGLSYDLFVQLFSKQIDIEYPRNTARREEALAFARPCGYLTPSDLEENAKNMAEEGYCVHGLDPDCCPCGCGEY